jgi:hypothetical protein
MVKRYKYVESSGEKDPILLKGALREEVKLQEFDYFTLLHTLIDARSDAIANCEGHAHREEHLHMSVRSSQQHKSITV